MRRGHLKRPLEYSEEGADISLIGGEEVRVRIGDAGKMVFGDNYLDKLGVMGLLVVAVRAHNLLAIPARRR